jgi:hypothetical protein
MSKLHSALATAIALGVMTAADAASAKTCKPDVLTVTSSSRIAGTEETRDARAKSNAINRWSKQAQATVGIAFKFWFRADEQKVECTRTKATSRCTASAKPCRIL